MATAVTFMDWTVARATDSLSRTKAHRNCGQADYRSTEAAGIWTIQSGIFPENHASLRIHHAAGFRTIGTRERIAQHRGQWRDVVLIERRSPTL